MAAMPEEFYRIKRLPPYVFAEVNALKAEARAQGRDVIDLGMGNPDGPTPPNGRSSIALWNSTSLTVTPPEIVRVSTSFGDVDVKIGTVDGNVVNAMPEYEQVKRIAIEKGVAFRIVRNAALAAFNSGKSRSATR